MTGWWGQLYGSFPANRGLSVDKTGRTQNQEDLRNTSFVKWRTTKIWAQLVDGTTQTCSLKQKQKHDRLDPPIASRAGVLCPGPC